MKDEDKSKEQLLAELKLLRAQLELSEKRVETEILQTKNDWESAFSAVTDAITVHDLDFNIIRANPSAVEMLSLPQQGQGVKAKCFSYYHGTKAAPVKCPSCQSLRSGMPSAVEVFEPHLGRHLEIRAMPRFDVEKQLVGLIHIVRDITQRKMAEAELERLMAAVEQAGEMIVITDPDGTIQYVNPAFEIVTGYSREEAIGQNSRILKSGRQDDAFYKKLWETVSNGRTWEGRIVNRRKDGTLFTEDATISPVRDSSGNIVSHVAVKRDVTEHLGLADQFEQAQKMESVGRLAGGVAHDFNNMLGVIQGYAEMAMASAEPGTPLHDSVSEIHKAALRSAQITRQLLAFARKQTISPRALNLNTTIEGMLKMLRRLMGEDINLVWLPGSDLWPVRMDPAQIDQLLANLCVNARDAIADVGNVTIETCNIRLDESYSRTHVGCDPGDYVMLAVSDNGCGMERETQKLIFEPFYTTKEFGKGTGLGLSIVYGVTKQNGGFVNVYSEPGHGTSFKIYLPREGAGTIEDRLSEVPQFPRGRGETLLLVEDDSAMLKMSKGILENLGYNVLAASSPAEAVRIAGDFPGVHLLVTDVVMPDMNGRDLSRLLRSSNARLKCLFMSGYTADVIARHGVLEPGINFIQKPFSVKDLAIRVRQALEKKE